MVGERLALLARAALASGEVTDRLDERPLLVGQCVAAHRWLRGDHGSPSVFVADPQSATWYLWYANATVRTMSAVFPTEDEVAQVLVGPDSVSWQRGSDARLYLVMLYPLLLQVAHPTVGAGVRDYSDFEKRPWARLLRTL